MQIWDNNIIESSGSSSIFNIDNPDHGDILSYDGSHFTNTNVLSGSNIDLINLNANNLINGVIPYSVLPNLAGITLSGDAMPPYIESITPISPNGNQTIEIIGEYFSPITQLSIPGVVVESLEVRSPGKIIANISKSGLSGNKIITLANGSHTNQSWGDGIKSIAINPDPLWQFVSLFIKGNGINDSINIIDESYQPKQISRSGAKISTAKSKYGGSSIYFSGLDNLQVINTSAFNFGTSNFTIEFWIFPISVDYFLGKGNGTSVPGSMLIYLTSLGFYTCYDGGSVICPTIAFTINQWQHIAIVRSGTNYTAYKDGQVHSSALFPSASSSLNTVEGPLQIGSFAGRAITAYFDSIRVTNSARYTAAFNPETDTYLNT